MDGLRTKIPLSFLGPCFLRRRRQQPHVFTVVQEIKQTRSNESNLLDNSETIHRCAWCKLGRRVKIYTKMTLTENLDWNFLQDG